MPNHIKNKIELIGTLEQIDALVKQFGKEYPAEVRTTYDNLIICVNKDNSEFCWLNPKDGRATNRSGLDQIGLPEGFLPEIKQGFFSFPSFEKVIPPPDDPAYRDEPSQDVARTSPNWWYTWNTKNWGTKWSGYSNERLSLNVFTFETAWSSVHEIIDAISRAYPNITIKYTWADEDTGHNCGRSIYCNGLIEESIPVGGTKEAYDIAFELRPDYAEDYILVDGNYKYKPEEVTQ